MEDKKTIAHLFYKELLKLDQSEASSEERLKEVYQLLTLVLMELSKQERVQFTTLFARMSYVCHKWNVPRHLKHWMHHFRKRYSVFQQLGSDKRISLTKELYALGQYVITESIDFFWKTPPPAELIIDKRWENLLPSLPSETQDFHKRIRITALRDIPESEQLVAIEENNPTEEILIQYGIADKNENFMPTIQAIRHIFGFPVTLNLLNTTIDEAGIFRPTALVVEPDYLIDVSATSECFKPKSTEPLSYLLKKYLPFSSNKYILIGNIANFFLDELMNNPEITYKEIIPKIFQQNPLALTLFSDIELKEILNKTQKHYISLKTMVKSEFEQVGIDRKHCFLEPAFYSEEYGLQGRLDVLYKNPDEDSKAAIIELKSGKPFMANSYGLSHSHYTQTLLYDLIIKSVFGEEIEPTNYILYSVLDIKRLRYAPVIKSQQYEAIQVRNQLVAIDAMLSRLYASEETDLIEQGNRLFLKLRSHHFPHIKGFLATDIEDFEKQYAQMSDLEKRYFIAFSGFIAREQILAKTGEQGVFNRNGLASLWLNSFEEKNDNFDLLSHLVLAQNQSSEQESLLYFNRSEQTNSLANFRQGDIGVLYPHTEKQDATLHNQIFKCNIIKIDEKNVVIRLRNKQFNHQIFEQFTYWNVEHDVLDNSFTAMQRGLYSFLGNIPIKKALLLTQQAPVETNPLSLSKDPNLTEEQQDILAKLLAAKDYFLLWGPPGTGKTSVMLKAAVAYLMEHTEENLMLLAYTNRAVDEICHAVESAGCEQHYIRISSKYATSPHFQPKLLSTKLTKVSSRQALKDVFGQHRIFIATVAAIANKPELLQLKHFNRVIIDEASQILEPNLVGLLPHFSTFILIGDHQQLPAVVVQDEQASSVEDEALKTIGLDNLRNSLFERLYKRCQIEQWHWAYAQLSHQGRMHHDIMVFPNQYFYEGALNILPPHVSHHANQIAPLLYSNIPSDDNDLIQQITQRRVLFIPTNLDYGSARKTNRHEAEVICQLVTAFHQLYASNSIAVTSDSIGVITPYRAQIAQIKELLRTDKIDSSSLTIDTVERYQGGARDVIIISLCTNSISQLAALVSLSTEGVDRKLNVALTRARKHLIVLGNPTILSNNDIYAQFIEKYSVLGMM